MDASAFVKLLLDEAESVAVTALLGRVDLVSSSLLVTEAGRAVRREDADALDRLEAVLQPVALLDVDRNLVNLASRLAPVTLRSLDAIHLASALLVADDLDGFVCYDARLGDAAAALGLRVLAPGNPEVADGV